jgi:hypothetical protein
LENRIKETKSKKKEVIDTSDDSDVEIVEKVKQREVAVKTKEKLIKASDQSMFNVIFRTKLEECIVEHFDAEVSLQTATFTDLLTLKPLVIAEFTSNILIRV